jgi:hypothetical protein
MLELYAKPVAATAVSERKSAADNWVRGVIDVSLGCVIP